MKGLIVMKKKIKHRNDSVDMAESLVSLFNDKFFADPEIERTEMKNELASLKKNSYSHQRINDIRRSIRRK